MSLVSCSFLCRDLISLSLSLPPSPPPTPPILRLQPNNVEFRELACVTSGGKTFVVEQPFDTQDALRRVAQTCDDDDTTLYTLRVNFAKDFRAPATLPAM